ncbi:MAG: ABC transporter substrate-binding protein [Leptospiraceae bacterium]|nr:ABC transporter substrate-binding protein [Leptospiraceae bacterium]
MNLKTIIFFTLAITLSGSLSAAERLITIGGCVTESVCQLGNCSDIVAVDVTSELPGVLPDNLPKLGYFTKLSGEGILSFKPTRMIAIQGSGPEAAISQVRNSKTTSVHLVNDGYTLKDSLQRIRQVGVALGKRQAGEKLASEVEKNVRSLFQEKRTSVRILFIYARGARMVMTGGKNTSADEYIRLIGGTNVISIEGFKPISAEAVISARPDVILIPAGSLFSLAKDKETVMKSLLALPGVAQTPAGKNKAVVTIDDSLLCGMGPRTPDAVRKARTDIGQLVK